MALALAGCWNCSGSSSPDSFETVVKPFVSKNCIGCHNQKLSSGDLNLQRFLAQTGSAALSDRATWEKVESKLKTGAMPPNGMPRPTEDRVAAVTGWIEREYQALDQKQKPDPGRVTARRLNRAEYNNTVHDLLGIDIRVADEFPVDPYGYGFDNNGDVLSLSPVLMERYLKAAERAANAAVPSGEP